MTLGGVVDMVTEEDTTDMAMEMSTATMVLVSTTTLSTVNLDSKMISEVKDEADEAVEEAVTEEVKVEEAVAMDDEN